MGTFGRPWSGSGGNGGGGGTISRDFGIYTPEQFGAVGDGVADDLSALQAMQAAMLAGNGIGLLRAVYGVSAPWVLGGGVRLFGYGTVAGKSTVRALGAMSAPVVVQQVSPGVPNVFAQVAFDANALARHAFLSEGNQAAQFTRCSFLNSLDHGERTANNVATVTVGPVTQAGAGPTLTVSVIDPAYVMAPGTTLKLKAVVAGALGTFAVALSVDGGVSYSAATQVMQVQSQLGYLTSSVLTGTGLLLSWQTGVSAALNTTWTFTVGTSPALNNNIAFDHCFYQGCGTVYANAGMIGDYPGPTYRTSLLAGTMTTTAASPLVTFTPSGGSGLLSLNALEGAPIRIRGLSVTNSDGTTSQQRLQLTAVLDDTHLVTNLQFPPNQSVAGQDFAIAVGAGFAEDIETGNQSDKLLIQPSVQNCAVVARIAGLGGSHVVNPVYKNWAISAFAIGTDHAD